ncbi:MAG: molecular chaperone HtpG [Saprospiraceae bacterium]|nr:molecular chaperone HtpG [Saprospiraceae bacterium]
MQTGRISVQTENIFPIIKKYLYSDQEIFLRELVSNAVDATVKLNALAGKGAIQGEIGDTTIDIILDKENKTLTIRDRGIGMSAEEVEKYLNQVAFSSAHDFIEKYKLDHNIIGQFGLGFYSAFMVADRVEAITKSHQPDAPGVTWSCDGSPEYTLAPNDKIERGTDIVLHIGEGSEEYLETHRIESLLKKYCRFLPVSIRFGTRQETVYEGEGEAETSKEIEVDNIVNNPAPAWKKQPAELSDEEYQNFYEELYPYSTPPMFWIHLNIDYPFNLTGILYFPKVGNSFEVQKNKIQLYSNQVFVTDDVKQIVPEFLTLLHGVIDSPDIPLNVSRSYLQADSNVKKITGYITKKVADKLQELFKKDRKAYEDKWSDLGIFVKYGIISDEKFEERAREFALVKNVDDAFFTLDEYREKVKELQKDKYDKVIFLYTNSAADQAGLVQACKNRGYDVLALPDIIDNHFIQHLEAKLGDVTFVRIDSDTVDNLIQKEEKQESVLSEKDQEKVKTVFESVTNAPGVSVQLKPMSPEDQPVYVVKPEFMRRFKEMQMLQGMGAGADFPDMYNVVVNSNHPLIVQKILPEKDVAKKEEMARHLYQLALLSHNMLRGEDLAAFVGRSVQMMR